MTSNIDSFDLRAGRVLAGKYEVIDLLGAGWESEVYLTREVATGIERAAKLFFPQRNPNNRVAKRAALKLHKLRDCPGLVQYIGHEQVTIRRQPIAVLISEYLSGSLLSVFLKQQRGKRLEPFEALHLLWALTVALQPIHARREFHGDLHTGNVLVQRLGIGFKVKLIDIFEDDRSKAASIHDDVVDLIRIFYDAMGGPRRYANHPRQIKQICKGLKRTLILDQFRTAGQLQRYLEEMRWDNS